MREKITKAMKSKSVDMSFKNGEDMEKYYKQKLEEHHAELARQSKCPVCQPCDGDTTT